MTTLMETLGRQVWAYTGGILAAATVTALLDNFLAAWIHGWTRPDAGRFPLAQLPGAIASLAVASFLAFLVPFVLVRLLVVVNAKAVSGRVGPLAAAVAGAVPAVVTVLALNGLFGGILNLDAYSLSLALVGGAVGGLGYRWLGGFPEEIRP